MYWYKSVALFLISLVAGPLAAFAQCAVTYPFQPNCPLQAAGLNEAFEARATKENPELSGTVTGTYTLGEGGLTSGTFAGYPAFLQSTRHFVFTDNAPTTDQAFQINIIRQPTPSGGSSASDNVALSVANTTNALETANEGALLVHIDNNGTLLGGTQNYAARLQAFKNSTGATWAGVFETRDFSTGVASGAPTTVEADLLANGVDTSANRGVISIVGGKRPGGSGTTPTITYGIRIGAQDDTIANATFTGGIRFNVATYTSLIDTTSAPSFTHGIDLSGGTCGTDAYKSLNFAVDCSGNIALGSTVPFAVGGYASTRLSGTTGGIISMVSNSVEQFRIQTDGTASYLLGIANVPWLFSINSAEKMRLSPSGGLSIGTTTDAGAGNLLTSGVKLAAAAPSVAAGQIGYGGTTAAASSCGSLAGAAGCIVVNVAGTTRNVPYY